MAFDQGADPIEIFTDGACSGNPGPGGWGAIVRAGGEERELCGGDPATTNNRMEMTAAIQALSALDSPSKVKLVTDSDYLRQGITSWIHNWRKRGWKTADNKPVKNKDLWLALEQAAEPHKVEWAWIKGHAGHAENERADALARGAILEMREKEKARGVL